MFNKKQFPKHAVTLIELLVAVAVTAILFGVVILMLRSSLDSFFLSQGNLRLQKALDDILTEITGEGTDYYGLIDATEFIKFSTTGVSFIPLWVDEPRNKGDSKRFVLTKPIQAGRGAPLVEVKLPYSDEFKPMHAVFIPGEHKDPLFNDDIVELEKPLVIGSKVRAVYVPSKSARDVVFGFSWNKGGVLRRTYKKVSSPIPRHPIEGVRIKDIRFEYFDNTNSPIPVNPKTGIISQNLFPFVTAIRVWLKVGTKGESREGFAFINLRNTRTSGSGVIIREGTSMNIPDSHHIRTLSIANVSQIKEGGTIEIEARPQTGDVWKINIELGFKDGKTIIKKYSIEYPAGNTVYSEVINMTTNLPLNFLTLGATGRYDYDADSGTGDVVLLEGDVELVVTKMDADAASLYVRP